MSTTATRPHTSEAPRSLWTWLGIVRILVGLEFLWAFFDKAFGWGFSTTPAQAWIHGGSPTKGYLSAPRALQGIYRPMAGLAVVDVLFMLGLLAVGIGITFGIAVRLSAIAGALMLLLMWTASFPIAPNPFIDYHLIELVLMVVFALGLSTQRISLAAPWRRVTRGIAWLQ